MTGLWIFVAVIVVLAVFQRRNLMRILSAFGAQFGKLARMIWRADPVAVYQAEVDRSADEIKDATQGLDQYRALVSRLQRQVATGETEVARLTARVKTSLTSGNDQKAAEYAVLLKKEQTTLDENKSQLAQYEQSYENNLKKVKYARERIEAAKAKAQKLQADLRLSRAEAETANLAQKFNVKTNTLEGLGEIEDEIQRQIDMNRGHAKVVADLSADGLEQIAEEEAAQKAEAQEVLEKMKQEMNLKS